MEEEVNKKNKISNIHKSGKSEDLRSKITTDTLDIDEEPKMKQDTNTDNELQDLQSSNELSNDSGNTDFHGSEEVVAVHEGMHEEVQVDSPTVESRRERIRVEGIDHGQNVMVPV